MLLTFMRMLFVYSSQRASKCYINTHKHTRIHATNNTLETRARLHADRICARVGCSRRGSCSIARTMFGRTANIDDGVCSGAPCEEQKRVSINIYLHGGTQSAPSIAHLIRVLNAYPYRILQCVCKYALERSVFPPAESVCVCVCVRMLAGAFERVSLEMQIFHKCVWLIFFHRAH